jgi:hypothetical protein
VFIWYILCSFGTFCVYLVHFFLFGIMYHEKSGNPGSYQKVISLLSHSSVFEKNLGVINKSSP